MRAVAERHLTNRHWADRVECWPVEQCQTTQSSRRTPLTPPVLSALHRLVSTRRAGLRRAMEHH